MENIFNSNHCFGDLKGLKMPYTCTPQLMYCGQKGKKIEFGIEFELNLFIEGLKHFKEVCNGRDYKDVIQDKVDFYIEMYNINIGKQH